MSEETPEYLRLPDGTYSVDTGMGRTIFADPDLLRPYQLAEMQRTVDEERTNHAGEPVTKMGYWPTAVAALLGHAEACAIEAEAARADHNLLQQAHFDALADGKAIEQRLTQRIEAAEWATDCAQGESRVLRAGVAALSARIEKAEAQVKEHPKDLAGLIRQIQLRDKEAAELAFEVADLADKLIYERQMRQQADEARDKLVRRVKEQQDELAEQEVSKLKLIHAYSRAAQ